MVAIAGELGSPEYIAAVVSAHEEAYGSLSVLVMNAGVGALGRVGEIPLTASSGWSLSTCSDR